MSDAFVDAPESPESLASQDADPVSDEAKTLSFG